METDAGYERSGWTSINTALGLTAIRIPEAHGGYGFGFGDQCIGRKQVGDGLPFAGLRSEALGAIAGPVRSAVSKTR